MFSEMAVCNLLFHSGTVLLPPEDIVALFLVVMILEFGADRRREAVLKERLNDFAVLERMMKGSCYG